MSSSSTMDLSKPLSDILRECTKEAHDKIQHSEGAISMLNGQLKKEEYVRFLMMLWHVYAALEQGLEQHATNPTIEPIYNPTLLQRAPSLSSDISQLLQVPEDSWPSHPIHKSLMSSPPAALTTYVDRIREIAKFDDPSPLVAHAYVRYLGDLSGGQNIRHTLAKAYELDEASGEGLSFYAFKELASSKAASLGEMKRIKDWFRDGMNKGAGDNVQVKAGIAKEAQAVFFYNGDLFNAILPSDVPSKQEESSLAQPSARSSAYVSSVLAVITAVSVAHFLLVVSGLSGPRGFAKLAAAEQWVGSFWSNVVQ